MFAEILVSGKTSLKSVLNLYHQNSVQGAQVYDNSGREETNVIEPMFFVQHQVDEYTNIKAQFVIDIWTAASDTKIDAQTGASGSEAIKTQGRISGKIGFQKEKNIWFYGGHIGFSSEYDYKSLNGSINVGRSFAQKNFTLGLRLQYYSDQVGLFQNLNPPETAEINTDLNRKIFASSINATQLLSIKDIIQFGFDYITASDFLESTANTVLIMSNRRSEQLPDLRKRYAFSTKWIHGIGENSALHTYYRYYFDDWEIRAHTLKLSYYLEIDVEDEDYIEFFLRTHQQEKSKYFSKSFQNVQDFMTSDSDFDNFFSGELGIFFLNNLGDKQWFGLILEDVEWGSGLVIAKRSNGMRYGYFQSSLGVTF